MAPVPAAAGAGPPPDVLLGQSVIPLINKLQDIFAQLGSASTIDLPQVAVVGSQSSGKSSVLEALVGRDFLPRGADVCTRRPLVLQLVQIPARVKDDQEPAPGGPAGGASKDGEEWGEFLHLPGRHFTDFSLIRKEIQAETAREVGQNKGISDKQIRLKVYSPRVLNITLVDLPGITKVPVGDQPSDIEARVRTMVLSYIKHETCIILAVSPANADLANSDALQMARIADPDGSRTIGVITKLDIMDRGTDARNFLLGNVIPLRLGYIGVVNRSQGDIDENKEIRDALEYEETFFNSRPVYHSLADRCGIPQLAKKLNQILVQHIRVILPELKARINTQMVTLQKELLSYGELTDKAGRGILLLDILTKYSQAFSSIVDGKNEEMSTTELSGGARIHYIFQAIFVKSLEEVDPCDDLTDDDIRTAIQNATGPKNVLFVPEVPFEVLIRRQIARLHDPSLQCARFIYDELVKISHRCETYELQRFPNLRRKVEETVGSFLREGLAPAETMIGHLVNMEMGYINTSHPSFIGGSKAVEVALQQSRLSVKNEVTDWKEQPLERVPEKSPTKARAILARNGLSVNVVADSAARLSIHNGHHSEKPTTSGGWGISSIFSSSQEHRSLSGRTASLASSLTEPLQELPQSILLREPPAVLRASDVHTEQEATEIAVTKLLLKSYYDIVRKNVQDQVPKAIMHFLVNQVKRELHNVFIRHLYRESLLDDLLQEKEEIAFKRKRCKEILKVLQQASWTLEDLPLDGEVPLRSFSVDATGLPPPSRAAAIGSDFTSSFSYSFSSSSPIFSQPDAVAVSKKMSGQNRNDKLNGPTSIGAS